MSQQNDVGYDTTQHAFVDMNTRAVVTPGVNADGSKYVDPSVPTASATPAAIVTSSQSRSNYAGNVDTMNKANENLRQVQSGQTAAGIAASLGLSPEQFLKLNPDFAAKGGSRDFAGLTGDIKPGETYRIKEDGTPEKVPDKPDKTTTNADGSTTTEKADGSVVITHADGSSTTKDVNGNISATIDPSIKKLFDDNLAELTTSATNAKTVMDNAAATLADDPAAKAAAENIKAQYDVLINQMKEKNNMLLGAYGRNAARSGMLQYANEMDSNFKSMEFDKAVGRVADLIQKENTAIAKSNAAFKSGDVKALDAATKDYQKTLEDKQKEILDLNKSINEAVKNGQAEIKQKQTEAKQQITDDIRISAALGKTMAEAIAKSGVTDQKDIDAYVNKMAEENGISNPDILKSSLVKEQQALKSLNLKNQNTESIMANRGKKGGGKNGVKPYSNFTNKPTAATITKVNSYIQSIGGNQAAIDAANSSEEAFYKVLNAIPKKGKNGS